MPIIHEGRGIDRDEETHFSTVVLTGEDAYEGLTAYISVDWTEEPVAVEGAVFVGEAPPRPEPIIGSAVPANG